VSNGLSASISYNEFGAANPGNVWSGMNAGGAAHNNSCGSWNSDATMGRNSSTGMSYLLTGGGGLPCSTMLPNRPILCMEQFP